MMAARGGAKWRSSKFWACTAMPKACFWLPTVIALQLVLSAASAAAPQTDAPVSVARPPTTLVLVPGAVTGIGTGGPVWYWRLCSLRSIGLSEWRVDFLQRLIKPNAQQIELLVRLAQ